jgi:SAM-dependent methyltransferase
MSTFGASYAQIYDALYAEKEYLAECDLIEDAFRRYETAATTRVLDLGCGTGGHAIPLAARGYDVTGIDRSSDMIALACAKSAAVPGVLSFKTGDAATVDAGSAFDAALLMFAVLGYQRTNDEVRRILMNARRHLRPGGLIVFDAWYGPGVLADPPGPRARIVETPDGPVARKATAELDVRNHLCVVRYRLSHPHENGATPVEEETHVVRYFFPMEIEAYLESAGFRLREMSPFGAPQGTPDARTWNVFVVAEAV